MKGAVRGSQRRAPQSSPRMFVSQESTQESPPTPIKKEVKKEVVVKKEMAHIEDGIPDYDPDYVDDEAETILSRQEGMEYYEDDGFKIKQVPPAVVVNRFIYELYSKSPRCSLTFEPLNSFPDANHFTRPEYHQIPQTRS
jgi:hypothetical protein